MDIKQLYYFTAVAQAGSYSKAAESLAVSQPTLSVTVKKLEEELGVQLFYAFNREQHLTDEGLRLWTKAKQILDLYQETLDDMKTTNKNSSGKFTLGLSPLFGACFFGDLIPNFSMEYPNIEIKMIEDGAYRIDQRIERGEVDIAVTLNSKRLSSFAYCHFSTQRNVALLHKSHPLAKEPSVTVSSSGMTLSPSSIRTSFSTNRSWTPAMRPVSGRNSPCSAPSGISWWSWCQKTMRFPSCPSRCWTSIRILMCAACP